MDKKIEKIYSLWTVACGCIGSGEPGRPGTTILDVSGNAVNGLKLICFTSICVVCVLYIQSIKTLTKSMHMVVQNETVRLTNGTFTPNQATRDKKKRLMEECLEKKKQMQPAESLTGCIRAWPLCHFLRNASPVARTEYPPTATAPVSLAPSF